MIFKILNGVQRNGTNMDQETQDHSITTEHLVPLVFQYFKMSRSLYEIFYTAASREYEWKWFGQIFNFFFLHSLEILGLSKCVVLMSRQYCQIVNFSAVPIINPPPAHTIRLPLKFHMYAQHKRHKLIVLSNCTILQDTFLTPPLLESRKFLFMTGFQ